MTLKITQSRNGAIQQTTQAITSYWQYAVMYTVKVALFKK